MELAYPAIKNTISTAYKEEIYEEPYFDTFA